MWRACLSALSLACIGSSLATASNPKQQVLDNEKSGSNSERQPNIVFILTDDQDVHLASLDYMPLVKKHLLDKGTYYNKHYCTTAVCCPSRVTLWTGKAAHNTNITDVNPPYGGYPRFVEEGLNENYLPVWLQQAGYNTYYTGKLFNVHTTTNYDSPYAAGFTSSDFQLDPHTYDYLNSTFQRNQEKPKSYEGQYVTDVLAEKAYGLLDEAVNAEKPFFLTVAPTAPHCNILMNGSILDKNPKFEFDAPIPAKRHEHLFEDVRVPRTEGFNPDVPSGVSWVQKLSQQNQSNIDYNDHFYRSRLRVLQAVDELIDGLFSRLETYNLLENTYIIYSSDNGFHIGQHRLQPGKSCGFEEDINIPLIIRGPGVPENESTDIVTTHTDLAPTFLDLLNIPKRPDFDGSAFPVTKEGLLRARHTRGEHVNVEYWGFAGGEGKNNNFLHVNNTYKALRIIGPGYNLYYSVWCNNEHELYDMNNDPHQLLNLFPTTPASTSSTIPTIPETIETTPTILNLPLSRLVPRLDSLLFVLKSCKNTTCVHPWKALHPKGDVTGLRDALEEKYDSFYELQQKRVWFERCENGYLVDAEGDMFERDGLAWDVWV